MKFIPFQFYISQILVVYLERSILKCDSLHAFDLKVSRFQQFVDILEYFAIDIAIIFNILYGVPNLI